MEFQIAQYRPSGRFRVTVVPLLAVAAGAVGLLAWVYQLLNGVIPFIVLNLLTLAGFTLATVLIGSSVVHRAHVRNRRVGALVGLLVAGSGLSASYFWMYRAAVSDLLAENPGVTREDVEAELPFARWINFRVESGWTLSRHGRDGGNLSGPFVYILWGLEALIVLGATALVTTGASAEPYCEDCKAWMPAKKTRVLGVGRADVEPLLQLGDLARVVSLEAPENAQRSRWISLDAESCPNCGRTYLSVSESEETVDRKGKTSIRTQSIASHLELGLKQAEQLKARVSGGAQKAA